MTYQSSTPQPTVVVCDDHPIYRDGVVRALRESGRITVVAVTGDGRSALAAIREHTPTVAVLDYRIPGMDGIDIAHAVVRDKLPTRVLILSASDDDATVYTALAEGAAGFITKDSSRNDIVAAVMRCAKGENILPASLASGVISEVQQRAKGDASLLTPRELETVRYIAQGLSVPQIAAELHLAPTTVRTHVQKLYEKLGVSDRGAAVAAAMRRRILD